MYNAQASPDLGIWDGQNFVHISAFSEFQHFLDLKRPEFGVLLYLKSRPFKVKIRVQTEIQISDKSGIQMTSIH